MTLTRVPISLREARRFVGEHHRHSLPPQGGLFAVSVVSECAVTVGVAIAGRPVAPKLDDGVTVEVTRCCTLDVPRSASMLYGGLCRAAAALGYTDAITYTLVDEHGTSLLAAGFKPVAYVSPQHWHKTQRPWVDVDLFGNPTKPTGAKIRWHRSL